MPAFRSLIDPGRCWLARHLGRLKQTLEIFGARLRDALSSAVGETVSGIVRETVCTVLAEPPTAVDSSERVVSSSHAPPPLWERPQDPDEEPWFDDPDNYALEENELPPVQATERRARSSHLPRAIAVGFHTMLCWLRHSVGRFPVLTAVAIGLLTALATYAGGPLAAALVSVAGSALNLLYLAEAVQTSADALAVLARS